MNSGEDIGKDMSDDVRSRLSIMFAGFALDMEPRRDKLEEKALALEGQPLAEALHLCIQRWYEVEAAMAEYSCATRGSP